jgi:hypothetical protein
MSELIRNIVNYSVANLIAGFGIFYSNAVKKKEV